MAWLALQNGTNLWYEDMGQGRPILLLHGWCFSSAIWRYQMDSLSKNFRVIALDFPGHGSSGAGCDTFTLESAAAAISRLSGLLGLRDVILCGWSLGAIVGLETLSLVSSKISALVLVGATPKFTVSTDWKYGLSEYDVNGLGVAYRRSPAKARAKFVSGMFIQAEIKNVEHIVELQAIIDSIPLPETEIALQGLEILNKADLRHRLPGIEKPVLIISGDDDSICLPAASCYLSKSLNCELKTFINSGHAPFLTYNSLFNDTIVQFIRRVPTSADR